jgi:hypothetical protein
MSKLCLAQTTIEEEGNMLAVPPLGLDLSLPAIPAKDTRKHRSQILQIDKQWQEGSRDEILDQLILLATDWEQSVLVDHFFRPYKEKPEEHHFLKDGVVVSIPQCRNITY